MLEETLQFCCCVCCLVGVVIVVGVVVEDGNEKSEIRQSSSKFLFLPFTRVFAARFAKREIKGRRRKEIVGAVLSYCF